MEWIALTEELILADFPSELRPLYDDWLVENPTKADRLASIIANTAAEIRALIASNPVNQLDEDETKIPLSLLRQAETLIYFTLSMEMGVSIAPEANQAMIRAEITLRTLVYGRYLVSGGSAEDQPSPLYNPEPEPPAARTLPALAAVLALFLGVTAAPAAWVKPPNPGTQLTEVDPFWTAFRAGELVTIGNNAVGSGDAVAIGTWANSDAGGFAIGSHADGSTFGSVLGFYSVGSLYGAAFGYQADGHDHGLAMGYNATGHTYGVALGYQAAADNYSVAIGADARSVYGLAAGFRASAQGQGAALGWYADAGPSGTAIGYTSRADTNGTAVGADASVSLHGTAVGRAAGAGFYGAALGSGANGSDSGVAIGYHALGSSSNIAIGYRARADVPETLIYGCNTCMSPSAEFPSPTGYMTGYPTNRISIGPDTFNLVDNSALIRGSLYLDGATAVHYRATFGTGEWVQAFPVSALSEADPLWSAVSNTVTTNILTWLGHPARTIESPWITSWNAKVDEAPLDSSRYVRLNGSWVAASPGGMTYFAERTGNVHQAGAWLFSTNSSDSNAGGLFLGSNWSFSACYPDGSVAYGAARGRFSVDLCVAGRNASNRVASGMGTFIGPGYRLYAGPCSYSVISGGNENYIYGSDNDANCANNFIGAGNVNRTYYRVSNCFIGAGDNNYHYNGGNGNFIGAGSRNTINAGGGNYVTYSAVVAGKGNTIENTASHIFIGAGETNYVKASEGAWIPAGYSNRIVEAAYAGVLGGFGNTVTGAYSMAGGAYAFARHKNSFVWANGLPVESSSSNQFVVGVKDGAFVVDGGRQDHPAISGHKTFLYNLATNSSFYIMYTNGIATKLCEHNAYGERVLEDYDVVTGITRTRNIDEERAAELAYQLAEIEAWKSAASWTDLQAAMLKAADTRHAAYLAAYSEVKTGPSWEEAEASRKALRDAEIAAWEAAVSTQPEEDHGQRPDPYITVPSPGRPKKQGAEVK
ncbi:MAG: hypothetical protein KA248_12285 [Kiritimatiellae bacterium]|nr:hypothetical protein [Kiritimatiellia bacterium]